MDKRDSMLFIMFLLLMESKKIKIKKKKINSKKKGGRGEREFSEFLRQRGFEARRGVQYQGSPDSPDIVHNIEGIHIEVKRVESLSLYPSLDQAIKDCGDDVPVVAYRKSNHDWVTILKADDFCDLVKDKKKDEIIYQDHGYTAGSFHLE